MEIHGINLNEITKVVKRQRTALPFPTEEVEKALLAAYTAELTQRGQKLAERPSGTKIVVLLHSIAEWLADGTGKPGLLLYGEVGTGKTTALKAMCRVINACCKADRDDYRLDDGKNMISIIRAKDVVTAYQTDSERYKSMIRAEMIGIDELGVEAIDVKTYGNSNEPIIDLLSTRYDYQRITAVSSNLDLDQICQRYGLRLADRFNEMFHKVGFVGASYRGYANQNRR